MKKSTFYFVLTLLFASCEKYADVNIELPFKSKLVSVSFFEEGSNTVQLSLTRTQAVIGGASTFSPEYVTNATVILQTPKQAYTLTYDPSSQFYGTTMSSEFFEAGSSYSLRVEQNGEVVNGNTVVPNAIRALANIQLDSVWENQAYSYRVKVNCSIAEGGPYNVAISASMVYEDSSVVSMTPLTSLTAKPIKRVNAGQQLSADFLNSFSSEFVRPVRIQAQITVCDDAYMLYANSISAIDWSSLGMPQAEPLIAYSNMSNRIGTVGSYCTQPLASLSLK